MIAHFTRFVELHRPGDPLFLVNAWDVLSAVALAAEGHRAVGTTSLGVTAAAGVLDGSRAGAEPTRRLMAGLQRRLDVPVTVDAEDGYSDDPGAVVAFVEEIAAFGAVGVNLEDAGRSPAAHARIVSDVAGRVPGMFVNARTDVFWNGTRDLGEAVERCRAYRDAGAHGLFVPGLSDPEGIATLVALGLPVNVLWRAVPDPAALGIARVSTGSALYRIALSAALSATRRGLGGNRDVQCGAAGGAGAPEAVGYDETQRLLSV
jgi:2-methylisocitrate lyase-like PEP mutase family enzyme